VPAISSTSIEVSRRVRSFEKTRAPGELPGEIAPALVTTRLASTPLPVSRPPTPRKRLFVLRKRLLLWRSSEAKAAPLLKA